MRTGGRTLGRADGSWRRLAIAAAVFLSVCPPVRLSAQTTDSLVAAAQRAARAWRLHDFTALVAGAREIALHLPGADPSTPLRPAQVAVLLRAFAEPAREVEVEVEVARHIDSTRAWVEIRRTYTLRAGTERRAETVYLGMHREGESYRLAEVRVVR